MRSLLFLAIAFVGIVTGALFTGDTRAAEELNHAGLVVQDAKGNLTWVVVPFAEETITGIDLVERSGLPVVTVGFGGLGEAVCSIGPDGCVVDECRKRLCQSADPDSPYWQYFRIGADGTWKAQVLGASATTVHDGDVDLWSWTAAGTDLPPVTFDEVAANAGEGSAQGAVAMAARYDPNGQPLPLDSAAEGAGSQGGRQAIYGIAALGALAALAFGLAGRARRTGREAK